MPSTNIKKIHFTFEIKRTRNFRLNCARFEWKPWISESIDRFSEEHKREAQTMSIFWHWKSIEQKNAALIKKKKNLQQQRKKKPAKVFSSFLRTVLTMTFFHSFITTTKRLSAIVNGPVTHSQTNENIREIHIEGSRACRASSNVPALNICGGNLVCAEKRDFLVNWAELISLLLLIFSVHLRGFHIT